MEEVCLWSKYQNSDFLAFDLIWSTDNPKRTACPLPHWEYRVLSIGHLDTAGIGRSGVALSFNRQDLQIAFYFWFDLYFVSNVVV